MEALSIPSRNTTTKPWYFRDLLREDIDFEAPRDKQERLKALKPDIAVVRPEYLAPSPPVFRRFYYVIEHKRGERILYDNIAIQDSLIRGLQTFNGNLFRQYVYSVFVAGIKLRLFQLHRGGVAYFDNNVDTQKCPKLFLKFVLGIWFRLAIGEDR
jgi:hypothetical protein